MDGRFCDLFWCQDWIFTFETESVDDFLVYSENDWIVDITVGVGLRYDCTCGFEIALADEPSRRFGTITSVTRKGCLDSVKKTYTKGRMIIEMIAKIPWNRDGARHAHVDSHCPVPSVMPAAIRAPT